MERSGEVFQMQQETWRLLFLSDVVDCGKEACTVISLPLLRWTETETETERSVRGNAMKEKLDKREEE